MIRSILFVPADSERFLENAHERNADAVALDLEDSVAPARKDIARTNLTVAVPRAGSKGAKVLVRINSDPDRWQLDAEAASRAGAFGIILPKTRTAGDIKKLATHLGAVEKHCDRSTAMLIIAVLEDPNAILDARSIAKASTRMLGMITGGEDLATSIGAQPTPAALLVPKLLVHLAAKAASIMSLGLVGTVANYSDLNSIGELARTAREYGFDGATCIHPSAVAILNKAFMPSADEIEQARAIVSAAEHAGANGTVAFSLDGRMVDPPIVARARNLLASLGSSRIE